ncbi:substrate-binding periplasmic protein [Desulfocurvus sp. DL9XJH121]
MNTHIPDSAARLGAVILVLTLALVPAHSALAAEPTLVFGCNNGGYPPYLMKTETGFTGITYDILTRALAGMGWKLRVALHPEIRGQALLDMDQLDARGKAKEWVHNPDDYWWSAPFLTTREMLVSRTEDALAGVSLDDLGGRSLALVHGFHYPAIHDLEVSGAVRRVNVDSVQKGLFLVYMGRADGALMDHLTLDWMVRDDPKYRRHMFFARPTPGGEVHYRLMFSKHRDWRPFIRQFDQRIEQMREDGTIGRILAAYR